MHDVGFDAMYSCVNLTLAQLLQLYKLFCLLCLYAVSVLAYDDSTLENISISFWPV